MAPPNSKAFHSTVSIAHELGVSVPTARRLLADDRLGPVYNFGTAPNRPRYFVSDDALQSFKESRRRKAQS
jgi:hypothetical protein